jgi:putative ABC transport system permease protein
MRMAAREMRRRPRSYLVPTGILLLLALLLLYPSAILDGILKYSTAAVRHAPADLIVYSREANGVQLRSRVDSDVRRRVQEVPGVAWVTTFDATVFTGRVEGREATESIGLALLSSEQPLGPIVPGPGEALVSTSLRGVQGVEEGAELLVGPFRVPVRVVGFTSDIDLWLLGGVVVDKTTWLEALGQPSSGMLTEGQEGPGEAAEGEGSGAGDREREGEGAAALPPGSTPTEPASTTASQALFVKVEQGWDPEEVAAVVDQATEGLTQTYTREGAVQAMPGVREQATIFGYIRLVTLLVALVVVGLFLSFLTLERTPLYAVLKAVGASSRQLFTGVVSQAVIITLVAVLAAVVATWGLTFVPLGLPTTMRVERVVETLAALGFTAVAGSIVALRRVVRIDPASAIG